MQPTVGVIMWFCTGVGALSSMEGRTESKVREKSELMHANSASAEKSGKSEMTPPLASESVDQDEPRLCLSGR